MGLTLHNLQIHTGGRTPDALKDQLQALLRPEGMVDASSAKEAISTVYLAWLPGSPWLTICGDWEGYEAVEQLMRKAAGALKATCMAVTVYDSDFVLLHLLNDGTEDAVQAGMEAPSGSGNPAAWAPLLVEGVNAGALTALWHTHHVFAEEMVQAFAPMIGLSPQMALMSLEAIDAGFAPEGAQLLPLYYAADASAGSMYIDHGLPKLLLSSLTHAIVGMDAMMGWHNEGGPGKGLRIVLMGEDIDSRALRIDALEVASFYDPSTPDVPKLGADRLVFSIDATPCRVGEQAAAMYTFPDIVLPPGITKDFPGMNPTKMYEVTSKRGMYARITFTLLRGEMARFLLSVQPLENPVDGAVTQWLRVFESQAVCMRELHGL